MAHFDVAAGVRQATMNTLIGEYYANPPAQNNPFKGSREITLSSIGKITIQWDIDACPVVTYGPPDQATWDAALNDQGVTNKSAGTPLPSGNIFQIALPSMTASYTEPGQKPIGGPTKNLVGYLSLTQSGGTLSLTPLAVTIDESSFHTWDKLVFNTGFLPQIFEQVKKIGSVIHIPNLTWHGISLEDPEFRLVGDLFVAAAVQTGSATPLDLSGATWPTDQMFALASQDILNAGIAAFTQPYIGQHESDHGEYKGLATWSYDAEIDSLTATVSSLAPLKVGASLSVKLTAGGGLTPAGMALAAAGCALGGAALLL